MCDALSRNLPAELQTIAAVIEILARREALTMSQPMLYPVRSLPNLALETELVEATIARNPPLLYNIKEGIAEANDTTAEHLEMVERLIKDSQQAQTAIERQ